MGTSLAPQTVCGRLSNPSLSPTGPNHGPVLTHCELVCVPGESMSAAAGAGPIRQWRGRSKSCLGVPKARWVAAAVLQAAPRRPQARFRRLVRPTAGVRVAVSHAPSVITW